MCVSGLGTVGKIQNYIPTCVRNNLLRSARPTHPNLSVLGQERIRSGVCFRRWIDGFHGPLRRGMSENLNRIHAECCGGVDRFVHATGDGKMRTEKRQLGFPWKNGRENNE